MHVDHRHWQSQIATWAFDLQQWHTEHEKALAELEQVRELIRQHESTSANHQQAVTSLSAEIKEHEHALAEKSEKDAGKGASPCADGHQERAKSVETLRRAHERIKKHHHIAMAKVLSLKASLEAAM